MSSSSIHKLRILILVVLVILLINQTILPKSNFSQEYTATQQNILSSNISTPYSTALSLYPCQNLFFAQNTAPDTQKSPETAQSTSKKPKTGTGALTPDTKSGSITTNKGSEPQKQAQSPEQSSIYTIGEIVVRERKLTKMEQAATTTVIDKDDIEAHSDRTLEDSLKMVPGLQVETHRKGYVRARMRGLDQNKLALLIDGIPVNDVYSTDIDISSIPVNGISNIIISRGVASALYGTSGSAGVINIESARPDNLFAEASVEYGQYNNLKVTFSQGAPISNFYYWITGSLIKSDGYYISQALDHKERKKWFKKLTRYDLYPNPNNGGASYTYDDVTIPAKNDYVEDDGYWDHNNYLMCSLTGKAAYMFDDHKELGLSVRYNYKTGETSTYQANGISNYKENDRSWTDPLFEVADSTEIEKAALRNRSFVWPDIHNVTVSPYTVLRFNRFRFRGNLYYSYKYADQVGYASTEHSYVKGELFNGSGDDPYYEIKKYTSYGCNLYPSWKLASWNTLTLGLLLSVNSYREEAQALSREKSPIISATLFGTDSFPVQELDALYTSFAVEDEMVFWKRLYITLGISYDMQYFYRFKNREALYQFEDAYIVKEDAAIMGTKDSFNPAVGIIADVVPDLLIMRCAGSIKTRFPSLSEYSKIVDDRRDNRLKPERSYNASGGIEFLLAEKKVSLRADYFYSMVDDRIMKISGGIDPPVNIEKVESQGLEFLMTYRHMLIKQIMDIELQIAYTYLHCRVRDNTPEEKVNKGEFLEYTPAHQISFDFRMHFTTGTSITLWGYSTIDQVAYAMRARPEVSPVQVSYSTSYFKAVRLHDPVMINIKISQRFLKHYTVYIMCKNIIDDYNADPFNPGPGRMFYGGLSANF